MVRLKPSGAILQHPLSLQNIVEILQFLDRPVFIGTLSLNGWLCCFLFEHPVLLLPSIGAPISFNFNLVIFKIEKH